MRNFKEILIDGLIIVVSYYISLALRLSFEDFVRFIKTYPILVPLFLFVKIGIFHLLGGYRSIWKFFSTKDTVFLIRTTSLSTGVILAITFLIGDWIRLPRTIYLIDWVVCLMGLFSVRLGARLLHESKQTRAINRSGIRTLIYGAGQNGKTLAQRFSFDISLNCNLIGFIDDDPKKVGMNVLSYKVLGTRHNLDQVIGTYNIKQLIIAIPNLSGDVLRELIATCTRFHIRPRIISKFTMGDEANRRAVDMARMVELSDLLNRPHKEIKVGPLRQQFQGKRVLVTGAGGSIGAEICRQVYGFEPAQLILLDHSELNLFQIEHELKTYKGPAETLVTALVNIKDQDLLIDVFEKHKPEIVIHAAAYKHVHLVEANPYSAILNNILGTRNLLQLANQFNVQTFLQISSDKAVNPVGIMGATKRVCELMVTAYAQANQFKYCSVRFGNVLGSSGSLIPTLQKQIFEGGPVTVTHPDMTRFFMLIPEAVSLVLTACTLARPGDINVLKMGEPVKIVDIARNLIALNGKTEQDIPIEFIGPRPGEKLFEELYIRGDELRTEHPDILTMPWGDNALEQTLRNIQYFWNTIENLIQLAGDSNPEALTILKQLASNKMSATEQPQTTSSPVHS